MRDEVIDFSIEVLGKGDHVPKSDTNYWGLFPHPLQPFQKFTSMYRVTELYTNLK
jgi:hypothetical protein